MSRSSGSKALPQRPRELSGCGSRALERRLSGPGARALLFHGSWTLPGPGIEPVTPALAGVFFTHEPPGKPCFKCMRGSLKRTAFCLPGFCYVSPDMWVAKQEPPLRWVLDSEPQVGREQQRLRRTSEGVGGGPWSRTAPAAGLSRVIRRLFFFVDVNFLIYFIYKFIYFWLDHVAYGVLVP